MKSLTEEEMIALLKDENFVSELHKAKTAEDARTVFAQNGVDMSEEEFDEALAYAVKTLEEKELFKDGELTEKGLELVAGGYDPAMAISGICGECLGLGILMGGGPIGWTLLGVGLMVVGGAWAIHGTFRR